METKETFGFRLKRLRLGKGYTQAKLADLIGAEPASIQKYEDGTRFGRREVHEKLAQILNVTISYLLYGEENREEEPSLFYYLDADPNLSPATKRAIKRIVEEEHEEARKNAEEFSRTSERSKKSYKPKPPS